VGEAGQAGGGVGEAGTSGQSGYGNSGQAGGGGEAGSSGQGAGTGGAGGVEPVASVGFEAPGEGAEVENPVAFVLKAEGVSEVGLVADDLYTLPLSWDVTSSATHTFTYSFTDAGVRTLVLTGYQGGGQAVASATRTITVKDPGGAICDGASGLSFQPPKVCDKVSGNTTSEIPPNGYYATSWFGCYFKPDGSIYKDPYDTCEFACGSKGLCQPGWDGPTCEANLRWFTANADRYGCGGRVRATNCANGRSVILATLDRGPNCKSVEQKYGAPVLDMSHDAMIYLFEGKTYGGSDKKGVLVEKVDPSTPLGPVE
jgi:hypothetical protein